MEDFIEFKNVVKTYIVADKKFNALDKVSFKIKKGEFVVILGPSGAGKSTLLNVLGGLDKVSSGSIKVGDKEITKLNDKDLTKYRASDIGFIFQFYNIMPTLTVGENVALVKDVTQTTKKVKEILKDVGLLNHIDKFPSELSGGEQQRVSIARAIMKNPKLMLCDEPTGALDSKTGVEVLKLLKRECENGTTVVIVTHNDLISLVANKVIHIKNGAIDKIITNEHPLTIDEVNF